MRKVKYGCPKCALDKKKIKIHLVYKDMEDHPLGDDLIETWMFGSKVCFASVDIPRATWTIEGSIEEVGSVKPRLGKKKDQGENISWCERCQKSFLILEIDTNKYGGGKR